LSTVTTALAGKLDTGAQAASVANGVYTTGSYADPAWITALATGKISLSTVTAALAGKLDNTVSVPQALVDLSTVTTALAGKLDNSASVPQGLIDLSTVTTALAGKLDTGAQAASVANGVYTTGSYSDPAWITALATAKISLSTVTAALSGKLDNTATVPQDLVDLSTVTTALSGKLDTGAQAASVADGVYTTGSYNDPAWITSLSTTKISLSTVTTALAAKLDSGASVPQGLINLSTVTTALAGKLDSGAQAASVADGVYTTGSYADPAWITALATAKISLSTVTAALAGKLDNTVSVPQALVDLSTVTAALAGKLDTGAQAASVADGVYTTGSYSDPAWITALATGKINLSTVTAAITPIQVALSTAVFNDGSYTDPAWITSIAGAKISGNIAGNSGNVSGVVALANGGTGAATYSGAQIMLGLVPGTSVQAYDADLDDLADGLLTPSKIDAGTLASDVIASSVAVGKIHAAAIQDSAVTSEKIADGTIIAADIAVSTISLDKLNQSGCADNQIPKWNGSAWACANDSSSDNLGNHIAADNLDMAGFDISAVGSLSVSSLNAVVDLGAAPAPETSHAYLVTPNADGHPVRLTFAEGASRLAQIESAQDGGATNGYLTFKTSDGGADWRQALRIASDGRIGLSTGAPQARLDVLAAGSAQTDMAQLWRDSTGAIISSVSATGVMTASRFVGDGSGLTGMAGDSLGSHIATATLNMAAFDIVGVSSMTVSSITTTAAGVTFSTNVFVMNGKVGIGTEAPAAGYKLDVAGAGGTGSRITDTASNSSLRFQFADSTATITAAKNGAFPTAIDFVTQASAGSLTNTFSLNGGNVGIGTANPNINGANAPVLTIQGSTGRSILELATGAGDADSVNLGELTFALPTNPPTDTGQYRGVAMISARSAGGAANNRGGSLLFLTRSGGGVTEAAERMRIDNSGNVGIGTAGPGYKLDVAGTMNAQEVR
ncbi:MAG: hypothetical protein HY550_12035, partial [Elusimicrobia bacterium]|nr:hypothetical protein [Elusimicrobiota bacterium]